MTLFSFYIVQFSFYIFFHIFSVSDFVICCSLCVVVVVFLAIFIANVRGRKSSLRRHHSFSISDRRQSSQHNSRSGHSQQQQPGAASTPKSIPSTKKSSSRHYHNSGSNRVIPLEAHHEEEIAVKEIIEPQDLDQQKVVEEVLIETIPEDDPEIILSKNSVKRRRSSMTDRLRQSFMELSTKVSISLLEDEVFNNYTERVLSGQDCLKDNDEEQGEATAFKTNSCPIDDDDSKNQSLACHFKDESIPR